MADRAKKISELNAHSNASGDDLLVIVDQPGLANAETKKITLNNLFANVVSNVVIKGSTLSVVANSTVNGAITINGGVTISSNVSANNITASGNVVVGNVTISSLGISTNGFTNNSLLLVSNNKIADIDTIYYETGTGIYGDWAALTSNGSIRAHSVYVANDFSIISSLSIPNISLACITSINAYSQVYLQNSNTGTQSSSDFVVTADVGTDTSDFGDFGINGSNFSNSSFSIMGALDVYLYSANSHLVIGTASAKDVVIFAGGTTSDNRHSTFYSNGQFNVLGEVRTKALKFSNTTNTPASAGATGTTGEVRIDSSYIYVCTATNTWKRAAISTW